MLTLNQLVSLLFSFAMYTSYIFKNLSSIILLIFSIAECANILVVLPSAGYSQYIIAEPLLVALAGRGHNVTVISVFETKDVKNLRNIVVNFCDQEQEPPELLFQLQDLNIFENIIFLNKLGLYNTEKILADNKVQKLIHSDEKFDLVLVETFANEAHHAFAKHFNAHQVLFHSMAVNEWNSHLLANPNLPSYLPNSFGGYTAHMTFTQRFRNTMALWFGRIYNHFIQYPSHQKLIDQYFPSTYNLNDILYNASLMLACSHVSTTEALPLTTSVVEVGGLHVTNKKLPDNIKEFLDSAEDGAIFFSMGSNIKSSNMPKDVIRDIVTVIGGLKQKVLWKFESDEIKDMPKNLMISKWFPQNDILAHPNTILFISHCGMASTTETIFHGVPVLGIPVYGDQFMNIRRMATFGMGLELPLKKLSGKILKNSIEEILNDPRYRNNAKKRSDIMRDRPMEPLDLAVYWIEYVLRHDGAHHLKNSIFKLTWYQLYLVDIIAVLFLCSFAIFTAIFILLRSVKRSSLKKKKIE